MKRIFNKSNQQPVTTSYQVPEEQSRLSPSLQSGGAGNRPFSNRQDEEWRSLQPTSPPSPHKRSGRAAGARDYKDTFNPPEQYYQDARNPAQVRTGRRPKSGGGGAYPSYGEVQLDSNDNRGDGQIDRFTNEPQEATFHQNLPARNTASHSPHGIHSRSQSAALKQGSDFYQNQNSVHSLGDTSNALPNPYNESRRTELGRHSSMITRKPLRGINRRASQTQGRAYRDEHSERPSRKPSLMYGIDSGMHGGYASAAMAAANEQDHQTASNYGQERDANVLQPESRYVDRYIDVRTPQSAAISNGMDKVKRRLFGRRKKDDGGDTEEGEKESSGEWARIEHRPSMDRQEFIPASVAEVERSTEQGNGHTTPWFAGKKQPNKVKEETITSHIGYFCFNNEDEWDWNQLQALCNEISHSEAASKEAARALRKEFKSGEEGQRFQAVRLWAIVCTRAGDRFRLQVATKKFLEVLEDLYFDKKTNTKLRGRLLLAWSMLAFEFQSDQDLHPITKMFNKVKPNEMPFNGVALDPSDDLFNPPYYQNGQQLYQERSKSVAVPFNQDNYRDQSAAPDVRRANLQAYPPEQRFVPPPPPSSTEVLTAPLHQRATVVTSDSNMQDEQLQDRTSLSDDLRRLHQECTVARGNAQLMTDALIEHGLSNELVTEFAAKTQQSQDYIMTQIPWVSALADRSRAERQSWTAAGGGADNNGGQSSKEEILMEDLLDTQMKLTAANGMIEEARDRQREEDEERQAIDQSMREQRMDRSTLVQETTTGQLYSIQGNNLAPPSTDGASSSRSASPTPPVIRRPLPVPGSVEMQKSISKSSQSINSPAIDSLQSTQSYSNGYDDQLTPIKSTSSYRGGPRPMNDTISSPTIDKSLFSKKGDDSDSIIMTPTAPSAKALGKRRAMSTRDSLSSIDNNVTQLTSQASNMAILESTPNEEALRARPPPALPNPPTHTDSLVSSNPYHQ